MKHWNRAKLWQKASAGVAVVAASTLTATACSPAADNGGTASGDKVTVSVRLWDEQVQKAYESSFKEFESQNPGIQVKTVLEPYTTYFNKLRTDVSAGNADDVFWISSSYFSPYADNGSLLPIGSEFDSAKSGWVPAAVSQYTRNDKLWGVPQLTDGGIGVYYNKDLVAKAGVSLDNLSWNPTDPAQDTFLKAAQKLTLDSAGRTADDPAFDANNIVQYGYNASQDLQAIYYNFIGQNGGAFQDGEKFVFASPQSAQAFQYIVDLINKYHVSPGAANSNDNGDFMRDQFIQGKISMFQSGTYNLANVTQGAKYPWAIAPMPTGPAGAVSVVNNIIAAGNAKTAHKDATTKVLQWLGSTEGAKFIGAEGAADPAVTGAQDAYSSYWKAKDVDVSVFAKAAEGKTIQAPVGTNYGAAVNAWKPIFSEIFLGRTPVVSGLQQAQDAANKAIAG
ncbi:sugar ABC transporter [Renibacterium salmoninarum ATCC 33209]|uniref:Sugar ABC transporter n=1 Tax=Renibacterium salmoninarum (strain ATCC 33209 / DSM 20767 / JCM 11484 / NBRC 15589 / NCIMB 2235) TaxID=288705 RepID=A9WMU4_RENSM|nr:sugar ABC transporter substrate-binding protein [Renibacterium salmoninarum]ABY23439.1 sugar ABC transporter [Renibacterium salmoninarum ATCC 33209]